MEVVKVRDDLLHNNVQLVSCVRNERKRLSFFLEYYRNLGINHFIFVDNGSSDGSQEFLLQQPDCSVFSTDESYSQARHGINWVNAICDQYCKDKWVLCVDGDELLTYPFAEHLKIDLFAEILADTGAEALFAFLLDFYPGALGSRDDYLVGDSFFDHYEYFDQGPYFYGRNDEKVPSTCVYGGVRRRMFPWKEHKLTPPVLRKAPLLYWSDGTALLASTHSVSQKPIGQLTGCLMHFKLHHDFEELIRGDISREIRPDARNHYDVYVSTLDDSPALEFLYSGSVRFADTFQLIRLGLINLPQPLCWTILKAIKGQFEKPAYEEIVDAAKSAMDDFESRFRVELGHYFYFSNHID